MPYAVDAHSASETSSHAAKAAFLPLHDVAWGVTECLHQMSAVLEMVRRDLLRKNDPHMMLNCAAVELVQRMMEFEDEKLSAALATAGDVR